MDTTLCISVRFIQPYPLFHGSRDAGEPEWPPSPMRLFQALLNAACLRVRSRPLAPEVRSAFKVLEVVRPHVVAPTATISDIGYRAYVPHNQTDLVTAAWHRGNNDASIASHRVEKDHHPMRITTVGDELPTVHYLYPLENTTAEPKQLLDAIRPSVRAIHCLGWGIDQVIADATLIDASTILAGERWSPVERGGRPLRVHRQGSLDALHHRHDRFLNRLVDGNWTPVPPLTAIDKVGYCRSTDPLPRPHAVFRLIDTDGDTVTYPQSKLIHIAGMVKHLAIEGMKRNAPRDLRGVSKDDWIERYVAGHRDTSESSDQPHTQLSYVPMQSVHSHVEHTDPGVRRVMIVAPIGDDAWLAHLARQLDGMELKPDPKFPRHDLPRGTRLELIPDKKKDGVRDAYIEPSRVWASTTPVILPGHDDHKADKTHKLIEKALQQSGIDQPCQFEWSAFSHFRKMLGAHKYVRDNQANDGKRRINYVRPDHLLEQSAVHLKLTFTHKIPGPITIGAGRHYGFGLMAAVD